MPPNEPANPHAPVQLRQGNANHAAHDADQDRFAQELLQGRTASAQGLTQANLQCAPSMLVKHHVHDANAANQKRNAAAAVTAKTWNDSIARGGSIPLTDGAP